MSNAIRHTSFIITLILLTFQNVAAGDISTINDISVTELMSDPKKYDGKQISVIGRYHISYKGHGRCYLYDPAGSNLKLGGLSQDSKFSDIEEVDNSRSRVTGRFIYRRSRYSDKYYGSLQEITQVVSLSELIDGNPLGLKLRGILTSEKVNTALFEDREGNGYTAKEGTWFPGLIPKELKRIQKDRVVITEELKGVTREFEILLEKE